MSPSRIGFEREMNALTKCELSSLTANQKYHETVIEIHVEIQQEILLPFVKRT